MLLSPGRWRAARRRRQRAEALYAALVAQARLPVFYADLGVADTPEGRFEMIALHLFLVLRRLTSSRPLSEDAAGKGGSGEPAQQAQALFDLTFLDMDRNLRELGVGDLGVGPRVKKLASAYFGRVRAYETGLAEGQDALAAALGRNLYNGAPPPGMAERMAIYVEAAARALATLDDESLMEGTLSFGSPGEIPGKALSATATEDS